MRTMWTIAINTIRINLQDASTYLLSFVMPIAMMFILALAMNAMDTQLLLDVVNNDVDDAGQPSELSVEFIDVLRDVADSTDTVVICVYGDDNNPDTCDLDEDADFADGGKERLEETVSAAAVIIPPSFGERLANGQPVDDVEYLSDDGLNAATVTRQTVETAAGRLSGSLAIANSAVNVADEHLNAYDDEAAKQTAFDEMYMQARQRLVTPPAVVETEASSELASFGANQSVPGIATMFVLISMLNLSAILIYERQHGTLQRLYILPTPKYNVVLGKVAGSFLFGLVQFSIFVVIGVFLDVNWGDNYVAIALVAVSFCMVATALGFLLSTFVKTADQAAGISVMMSLTLAPLGGAWWPLDIVPDFMRTIGHISPIAWAMDAFTEIIYHNGGIGDILPMVGVMIVMAVAVMTVAVWRFKYE